MIEFITLKFGSQPESAGFTIPTAPVTVFVGPNNSGKSKVLGEIARYCRAGEKDAGAKILDDIGFIGLDHERAVRALEHITISPIEGTHQKAGYISIGRRAERHMVRYASLLEVVQDPGKDLQGFCGSFLKYHTLILNGSGRIDLVSDQTAGDLQGHAQNSFQVLFRDDTKREEVRRIIHEAFGEYFVLDPTKLGHLRIRLSKRAPSCSMEERGIHDDAVQFHGSANHIDSGSDGVKAFTGIIVEVLAGDPKILLIDEPEAFLHPSLSSKLGHELSRAALATDKRIFVSTHSPAFVMGCIQSGAPVNIVRLTYRGGVATARVLPSDDLVTLMRNPLLRSTGVLSGLFYEFVVVTESDTDRAFYQEINERLLQNNPVEGIPNCLFLNAQNKQTIKTILKPLRKLGIPAAGVVDVDILKDGGSHWTGLLEAANVPNIAHPSLSTMRADLKRAMDNSGKEMKRDGGLTILPGDDQEAAKNLFQQLGDYGIFAVPGGELESWLRGLNISGHGPAWLIKIFEAMGNDPNDLNYLRPANDDVWQFMKMLKTWLVNPNRKGIPS